jgi:NADH:ubiquinone oxidoreductase subunit 4 (subunit M)
MFDSHLLRLLIVTPLIGSVHLLFSNERNENVKKTGLIYSLIVFVLSTLLWVHFDESTPSFQFLKSSIG